MEQSKDNNRHIDAIIVETFELVKLIYQYHNAATHLTRPLDRMTIGSRLVFPKKRNGKTRISEQELRFAFVEVFNQYVERNGLNWFYSVEMPTRGDYGFSGIDKRNALFDLSIIDSSFNRIALIEFKANNPKKEYYNKDMQKLANPEEEDDNTQKYFVQIVENHDKGTINSIDDKTTIGDTSNTSKGSLIHIRVYSLSKGEEIINKTTV